MYGNIPAIRWGAPAMALHTGRHFLQIPGPTNVPDRVLRAIDQPTMDHRGPEFAALTRGLLQDIRPVFGTTNPVVIYPSSGTGAWEAALANTLSPSDRVLMVETGHFAALWCELARRLGLEVELIAQEWGRGVPPERIEAALKADTAGRIKAVCAVHNETSTGVASRIAEVRAAIDAAGHDALFLVDTISSLASIDYRHDEWRVDVTVGGSQKGLMLPPGLGFNAVSDKALAASKSAKLARSYWDWDAMLAANRGDAFPYTPATNLLYGLRAAIDMLNEEGLANVFARHARHAAATRAAVQAWGLRVLAKDAREYSGSLTAVELPDGHDADALRALILQHFDMSLGNGLGKLKGRVFRIGHLGAFNDLTLAGTLCGVEMGLSLAGVPFQRGGVDAALGHLMDTTA
jgi:alanine-glyoxylate transaminase/serine-glyoxylate transaminase/serine-pyruvate transaminase